MPDVHVFKWFIAIKNGAISAISEHTPRAWATPIFDTRQIEKDVRVVQCETFIAPARPTMHPAAIPAPPTPTPAPLVVPHTLAEDAVAIFTGVLLISVGVAFFSSAGLLTGGTAGLAFLLHYATGIGFGKIFFVLNLPFYWLALRKLGRAFTIKTFLAVLLLSLLTELQSQFLQFAQLQPLYAAIAGGLITGAGFLVLFRHRCSLGGVGIAALYLQDRYGWRAGKVQMAVDCCIVLLALWTVEPLRVLWSMAGAVALNVVLSMNHRPGRYMAV